MIPISNSSYNNNNNKSNNVFTLLSEALVWRSAFTCAYRNKCMRRCTPPPPLHLRSVSKFTLKCSSHIKQSN